MRLAGRRLASARVPTGWRRCERKQRKRSKEPTGTATTCPKGHELSVTQHSVQVELRDSEHSATLVVRGHEVPVLELRLLAGHVKYSDLLLEALGDGGYSVVLMPPGVGIGRLLHPSGWLDLPWISIEASNLARNHTAFVFEDGKWFVLHSGTTNPTLLNGRRIEREPLRPGDNVRIADVVDCMFLAD